MLDLFKLTGNRAFVVALIGGTAATAALIFVMSRRNKKNVKQAEMELVGEISALYCYPIKSVKGVSHDVAFCTHSGLRMLNAMDRSFVVVRANGDFITQRNVPKLAAIKLVCSGDNLVLQADSMVDISVPLHPKIDKEAVVPCRVWEASMYAHDCGSEVGKWLSDFFGEPGMRLIMRAPGITHRDCKEENATEKDKLTFQDEGPFLLTTEASLADLLQRVGPPANEEINMSNFRPNIVVKCTKRPWDEDEWSNLLIGKNLRMNVLVPMKRCVLTTVNPKILARREDGEPLKTLKNFRIFSGVSKTNPLFGISVGVQAETTIRVGDPVYATRKS